VSKKKGIGNCKYIAVIGACASGKTLMLADLAIHSYRMNRDVYIFDNDSCLINRMKKYMYQEDRTGRTNKMILYPYSSTQSVLKMIDDIYSGVLIIDAISLKHSDMEQLMNDIKRIAYRFNQIILCIQQVSSFTQNNTYRKKPYDFVIETHIVDRDNRKSHVIFDDALIELEDIANREEITCYLKKSYRYSKIDLLLED
jgi:GTPase SAR1 family protein